MRTKDEIIRQLEEIGIKNVADVHYNFNAAALYERAIRREEGSLAYCGPLVVRTGQHTGRSPNDKFIVEEPSSQDDIWWGKVNRPIDGKSFYKLYSKMLAYIQNKDLYIQDCFAGADEEYRLPVRVITENAWHNLFARNMFIAASDEELKEFKPEWTVMQMPSLQADPTEDNVNSPTFIVVNYGRKLVLIGGTSYGGEIKKSIFSVMNYILPKKGVMAMHCSANIGKKNGDVAVLFGLSGTGKTTLSADPERALIGDDEHGWSDKGVFNFEGGCYAKMIKLSEKDEPEIFGTTQKFGTILENVGMDNDTRKLDLFDGSLTENTRGSYPLTHLDNIEPSGTGGHPKNVIMLTADAFGVLPPVSKLTPAQAMYHFISGYTAKVAGTEKGITEPVATFSACFGAPFMPMHPNVYAKLLGEKIKEHNASCWLLNTGWSGGAYGEGERMKIKYTRAMLNAALNGELDDVETEQDPFFGLHIPKSVPNVPTEVLNPRNTWKDKTKYDENAQRLVNMFRKNFEQFADGVDEDIKKAGPIA